MKLLRSIAVLCLARTLAAPSASAVNLPVSEDTYGTTTVARGVTKTAVTSAAGKASSLPISKTRSAFFRFDAGGFPILPASVIKARLTIYLPAVIKPGDLTLHVVTEDWVEKFTGAPHLQPAFASSPIVTIPSAAVVAKQFIIVDVTATAKAWLTSPASDFGLALVSKDGVASVLLGAKEGSGSGYPAALEIETNGAASVFQNGDVSSGILNGASIATGSIGGSQIATNIGLWSRSGTNFSYSGGNVGIGTSTPGAPLEIKTGPATFQIRNDGGVVPGINITGGGNPGILRLRNSLEVWPNDAGTAPGVLDVRSLAGLPAVRLDGGNGNLTATGRIGIGTTNPGSSLEINTGNGTFQIRNDSNLTAGINVFGGSNPGVLRLRNALEITQSDDGTTAGRLDVRDETGAPRVKINGSGGDFRMEDGTMRLYGQSIADFGTIRRQMVNLYAANFGLGVQDNTLYQRSDGGFAFYRGGTHSNTEGSPGSGGTTLMKVDPNGNLTANNLPGVEFATSVIALTCPVGVNTTISQVSVSAPAAGYIILTASIDIGGSASSYVFRLRDTTSSTTTLISTAPLISQANATLTYVVQVNAAGTKTFDAIINPTGNSATVGDRNFSALYVPVRY